MFENKQWSVSSLSLLYLASTFITENVIRSESSFCEVSRQCSAYSVFCMGYPDGRAHWHMGHRLSGWTSFPSTTLHSGTLLYGIVLIVVDDDVILNAVG